MTLNSLLTREVWLRSRESAGTRENEVVGRPTRLYTLMAVVLLRDGGMERSPAGPREEALPMRDDEREERGESPKIFR